VSCSIASTVDSFEHFNQSHPQWVEAEETDAPLISQVLPPSAARTLLPLDSPAKIKISDLAPTAILPGLYIGAKKDAHNRKTLAALGVKAIVNVTKDVANAFPNEIEYLNVPVDDHWSQDLSAYFDRAYEFIHRHRLYVY
jgi:hypothetical protein